VYEVILSHTFKKWFSGIQDRKVVARILARLERVGSGNLGDHKPVREGIREMRIDCGPGYRLYFMRHGRQVIVLLAEGDKRTQDADIIRATQIAKDWKPEQEEEQ
jgi:putative addiction module killer protein